MESLGLLVGHLIGDYVFQNDWMAANKVNPRPGIDPWKVAGIDPYNNTLSRGERAALGTDYIVWSGKSYDWWVGHLACTVHCLLYTLAVWACSFWWMPWWGLLVCFLAHWPIDRFRLAAWWMRNISGQKHFASKEHPLFPWSIVTVDNTFHLLTLFVIGVLA
jgi:hypothetical protein